MWRYRFSAVLTARVVAVLTVSACLALAAQASAYVYWADSSVSSVLGRANLDGTSPNSGYICGASSPVAVAVDGSHIYWVNGNNTIGRANLDGSGVNQSFITLGSSVGPVALAVDSQHIYWANGDNTLGRANIDGTGVNNSFITGVNGSTNGGGLAVNGSYIYWSAWTPGIGGDNLIERANLNGSSPGTLFWWMLGSGANTGGVPAGVAVDGSYIYWAEGPNGSTGNAIGRATLDGSVVAHNLVTGAHNPYGVAVDGSYIYWTNIGNATIGRANIDGSAPNESFSTVGGNPVALAVDASTGAPGSGTCSSSGGGGGGGTHTQTLTVTLAGSGSGTVTSSPAGISCPGTCSYAFLAGSEEMLTATPAAGSTFAGWSGAGCVGTASCPVPMDADRSVTATFTGGSGGGASGGGPPPPPAPPTGSVSSASASSSSPTGTATASNSGTTVTGAGEGALTVSQYASDPAGKPSFSSAGTYFDVKVASGSTFSSLIVSNCNLGGGTTLEWWTGSAWVPVSPQTYTAGPPACASATLGPGTTPTIAQLTGTVFAVTLRATAAASRATVRGASASVPIHCTGGSRSTCALAVTLTAPSTKKKVVVVGSATVTLSGGRSKTATVSLNGAGRQLLAARHTLAVKLTITQSGSTISSSSITFKARSRKHAR